MRKIEQLQEISDLLESRGVECTVADLEELDRYCWENTQRRQVALATGELVQSFDVDADIGRIAGVVFGAILGAFFLPGLGLAAGWFGGALLGGAIGYRLVGLFSGPGQREAPTKSTSDPLFRFSGVGSLALLNNPIPVIYGNRTNNPSGGVYLRDPAMIWSKIYSRQGGQYLERLSLLAVGVLGSVSTSTLLIDDQQSTTFASSDIAIEVSSGLHNQSALGSISDYSQAVALNTNSFVGTAAAVTVGNSNPAMRVAGTGQNLVGVVSSGSDIVKNAGTNAWDAGYRLQSLTLGATYGCYLLAYGEGLVDAGNPVLRWAVGLSATSTAATLASIGIGVEITAGNWQVWALGVSVASGTLASIVDGIGVEVRVYRSWPTKMAQVLIGGVEVWRGATTLADTLFADYSIHSNLSRVRNSITGTVTPAGDLVPGLGTRFQVSDTALTKLRAAQSYRADGVDFSIAGKDSNSKWIETNTPLWLEDATGLSSVVTNANAIVTAAQVSVFYKAAVSTSKPVTAIDVTLNASVWARDLNGNLTTHAAAFEISIDPGTGALVLGQFILVSISESAISRTVSITDLPRASYTVLVRPLSAAEITAPIRTLAEDLTIATISTGVTISGSAISLRAEVGETLSAVTAQGHMSVFGKSQLSSDGGPVISLSHLNEIVNPISAPTYSGYTIARTRYLASDRIQTAPSESHDIAQGQIVRQYLYSGEVIAGGNTTQLFVSNYKLKPNLITIGSIIQVVGFGRWVVTSIVTSSLGYYVLQTATFAGTGTTTTTGSAVITTSTAAYNGSLEGMPITGTGIPSGAVVLRKLGSNQILMGDEWGRRVNATATGSVTVTINGNLNKTVGAEVVVYRMGSSNYFPDLYVDRLINPVNGMGNYIDQNFFVDYPSIVEAREFCVRNNYFFDGVIQDGSFEEWAIATAPSSLLFCTKINGRYGLVTQEDAPARSAFLFNDSNTVQYTENSVPWYQSLTNTVLVKYQDNLGREKQLKIQTTDANNGTEPEIVQTVSCQGVTSQAQAEKVGQVALKSLRIQTRACQVETDVEMGLYTRQGKLIRTQHTATEYSGEESGFILSVSALTNPILTTVATIPIASTVVFGTNTQINLTAKHNLKPSSATLATTSDTVQISGCDAALDASYSGTNLRIIDDYTIFVGNSATPGGSGATTTALGNVAIRRTLHDQTVTFSEPVAVAASSRVTVAHRDTRLLEADKVVTLVSGVSYRISGVEESISVGDAFAFGEQSTFYRTWRVTSIDPDVKSNRVTLTGVIWDSAILDPAGTVTVT
jgi:hypothetical protein